MRFVVFRDYGAGLSIDEMIGLPAQVIVTLSLPNEEAFKRLKSAARSLCDQDQESCVLMEVWGEGETVWMDIGGEPVLVWPSGQIQRGDSSSGEGE
jgi:hypothetical protein